MRRWQYLLEDTAVGMRRRLPMLAVTTALLTGAFLIAGFALLVYANLSALVHQAQSEVRLRVYLREGLPAAEAEAVGQRLKALPGVAGVTFTTKERAVEEFLAQAPENRQLLAGLGENPLPASYEVQLRREEATPPAVSRTADEIKAVPGVDEVLYAQAWVAHIATIVRVIQWGGWLTAMVVGCAIVAIVSTTMRLVFHLRRDEIEILQLLGAPPWTLAFPFTAEGVALGLMAGGLALLILGGLFTAVRVQVAVPFVFLGPGAIGGLLAAGTVLGGLGGWAPLRRVLQYGHG